MHHQLFHMIFSVNENTITAYGVIWEGDGMEFVSLFNQLEKRFGNVVIKLHTDGGSVFDGNLMFNAIRNSKIPVSIHIVGIAASMGAVIALACDDVKIAENGFLMIHEASGYTRGGIADHESSIKLLKSIRTNFVKKLTSKTGKTESYVQKNWLTGDNWIDAQEALESGLVSEIIDVEAETGTFDPTQFSRKEIFDRFAALLNDNSGKTGSPANGGGDSGHNVISKLNATMKKPIIEALGLTGVTENSSDTAIIDAVRKHYEGRIDANQKKLDDVTAEFDKLKKEVSDARKAEINALLDGAKKSGKITAAQQPVYEKIAEDSGIAALKIVLEGMSARSPITNTITGKAGAAAFEGVTAGRENWDWDQWQKEDPRGLEKLHKEDKEAWEALFNAKYKK